jgi:hypothetical protein
LQSAAGSIKQSKLKKLAIGERWTDELNQCFQELNRIIANTVTLSHSNSEHQVCLFTDASDKHWGLVVTQVPPEDVGQWNSAPLKRNRKRSFSSHGGNLLLTSLPCCGKTIRTITDHRNLMHVFDPVTRITHFRKQTADKLARWASRLYEYHFVIEHFSGERNVCGTCFPDGFLLNQSRQTSRSLSVDYLLYDH